MDFRCVSLRMTAAAKLTGLGSQALDSWNEYFDYPAGNRLGLISASAYIPAILCVLSCSLIEAVR